MSDAEESVSEFHKESQEIYLRDSGRNEADTIYPRFLADGNEAPKPASRAKCFNCGKKFLIFDDSDILRHYLENPHDNIASCLYCKKSVFQYQIEGEILVFHNCNSSKSEKSSRKTT